VLRYPNHGAQVSTTLRYRDQQGSIKYFTGSYRGTIVRPRGTNGFGFDPACIAEGQTKTNAELGPEQKSALSARGKAARQLADYLKTADKS